MDRFRGILQIRLCNPQSRSEGRFAFLVTGDDELELCREGGLPMNDPYYEPYEMKHVEIEGTISHGALIVESITELPEEVVEEVAEPTEVPTTEEQSTEQEPVAEECTAQESDKPEDK